MRNAALLASGRPENDVLDLIQFVGMVNQMVCYKADGVVATAA